MRRLRTCFLPVLIVISLLGAVLPASADESPTASFTSVSRSFTPNGDGVNDVFRATLAVSEAAQVKVFVGSPATNGELILDRTVDDAASIPVSWDGRFNGTIQNNRSRTLVATIDWVAGGFATRQVEAYPYTADGMELSSPGAGALLFGDVPIRWKQHNYWEFDLDVSGCGSFHQALGESGNQYPDSLDFSSTPSPYQSFDASHCSPGPHTLTVTGGLAWGSGDERLKVVSIPIVIPGEGPQLVIQPDLAPADKVQTLLRYDGGLVAPVSWPLRCRDADPASFVLRIRDTGGEVVRTFRDLQGPAACRSTIVPGVSWDGLDDRGDQVPDGDYTVEAEISDAEGRAAVDRAKVVVRQAEPPLTLTSVSAGDDLGRTVSLVWQAAAEASVRSIDVKVSGCEARKPYGWSIREPAARPVMQNIDISMCPPGPRELSWSAQWSDAAGTQRVFTRRVPITIVDDTAPQLRQWGYGNLLTPSEPGTMNTEWFLTCFDVSPVQLGIVVRNSSGVAVATLRDESPTSCRDWESNSHQNLAWDGTGADGLVVPAGSYSAVVRASDSVGNTSESTWLITVDPSAPFHSSVAADSEVGPDDVITWTPRDGVTAIHDEYPRTSVRLQGQDFATTQLPFSYDADGRLRVPGVGQTCVGHEARLSVSIDWRYDSSAAYTWRESIPIRCVNRPELPPTTAVSVTGTARTDQMLKARVSGVGANEQPVHRWQRDGHDIVGATKDRYTLTAADVGHEVRVKVSVAGPPARLAISSAVRVRPGALISTTPTVRGTTRVGQHLTVSSPAWQPTGVALSHQWLRNGRPVPRAAGSRYTLTTADRGTTISVRVTGRKAGYVTTTRTSASTTRVR